MIEFTAEYLRLDKTLITALAALRQSKKGAHPAARAWYVDLERQSLYVTGETMALRVRGDIIAAAENPHNPGVFDVDPLRKFCTDHVKKGVHVRLKHWQNDEMVADAVQDEDGDTLCSVALPRISHLPKTTVLDDHFPPTPSEEVEVLTRPYRLLPVQMEGIAKVAKAVKAAHVRMTPFVVDGHVRKVRADFAVDRELGSWSAVVMPAILC